MERKELQKRTSECSYETYMIFSYQYFIKSHSCENNKTKKIKNMNLNMN